MKHIYQLIKGQKKSKELWPARPTWVALISRHGQETLHNGATAAYVLYKEVTAR
jgi:hypothetical protein